MFILADGLGGHRFGELASECVVSAMLQSPEPAREEDLADWLRRQAGIANEKLLDLQKEKNAVMKSTLAALVIRESRASWAHIGDSRLYYFHQGGISAITEDHSVAYRKYKAGEISRAQIGQDADQSRLLRSLGSADHCQPDLGSCTLSAGDAFLLCTDGAWEYLRDEEILVDCLKAGAARQWVELLLLRVMGRIQPGSDNLSLIAVLVH